MIVDPPPVEQFVTVLDCDICYVEYVEPESEPVSGESTPSILYVHGNLGSYRWFELSMDIPGYRTIALDLPNCGRSGRIDSFDTQDYGRYVAGFIRAVDGGPVLLVGHSLGGAVAMSVACSEPELVERLLLVDSAPVNGLVTPPERYPIIEEYRADVNQLRMALKTIVPTLSDEAWFDILVEDARRMNGEAYIGHARELGLADFSRIAGDFPGPVLVVRGDQDWLITAEMATRTANAFDANVRTLAGVGHSVMVENPELFNSIVLEFAGQA